MFLGYGLIILFALLGWELAEQSYWFAEVWSSELNRWIILLGAIIGLPLVFSFVYSHLWGKRKLIRTFKQVSRLQIADCQDGQVVRIQGELVTLPNYFKAPFSKRECAVYSFRFMKKVQRVTGRSITEEAWETVKCTESSQDFLIQCEDHYALVRSEDAEVIINIDFIHDEKSYKKDSGGFLTKDENEDRRAALEAINIEPKQYLGVYAKDLKFEEGVLQSEEQVAVMGIGVWVQTKGFDELKKLHEKGIDKVLEFKAGENNPLIVSDAKYLIDNHFENYNFRQKAKSQNQYT